MDHALALELLWLFSYPEIRHGFLSFGHCHYLDRLLAAPRVSKEVIWCMFYRA
jgi:hypothetical protein